jgi:hypothetical protein
MSSSPTNPKMELLNTAVFEKDFTYDAPEKRFFLCACDSWETVATHVQPSSRHFGLLLVGNAKGCPDEVLIRAADELQERGLAYVCAWGDDCGRVEDIFDDVYVEREVDGRPKTGDDDTLMTTSHRDDALADAVWFFAHCAWPTKFFASDCKDWIVAVVADKKSESYVRENIAEIVSRGEN